jgi:hypothetical protein
MLCWPLILHRKLLYLLPDPVAVPFAAEMRVCFVVHTKFLYRLL